MFSGHRIALIVAVDKYAGRPLSNCIADARKIRAALEERGFECTLVEDPTQEQFVTAIEKFKSELHKPTISLFYFAGHALDYGGAGFLIPCDYPPSSTAIAVKHYTIPVSMIVDAMNYPGVTSVVVLDACRNWPPYLTDVESLSEHIHNTGIAERKWDNTLIAYSTSAGDAASDGAAGRNSQYCIKFCEQFVRHGLTIEECFRNVGQGIINESRARQKPWYYSSLRGNNTFSDLAIFELVTAHKLPFDEDSILFMSAGSKIDSVSVAGRKPHLWEVDISGPYRANHSISHDLVAACPFRGGLATISEDGILSYATKASSTSIKTNVDHPHGIFCNGIFDIIIYGLNGFGIYRLKAKTWQVVVSQPTPWSIHCGTLISRHRAWLGGSMGHLVEVKWDRTPRLNYFGDKLININALCLFDDASVLCGGDLGLLLSIDLKDKKKLKDFQRSGTVSTASMKRQSLINKLDDGRIMRYLFDRDSIVPGVLEVLDASIQQCRVLFVHVAPSVPLIASGNSEGVVEIIDSRDGQLFQRLDAQNGLGADIQGVRFLSDTLFVSLSSSGVLRFYASQNMNLRHSGPFLKTVEEDQLLIAQGLEE